MQAERFCSFQIDQQFNFSWKLHRYVGYLLALKNLIDQGYDAVPICH